MAKENQILAQATGANARDNRMSAWQENGAKASPAFMEKKMAQVLEALQHGGMRVQFPNGNRYFFGDASSDLQAEWVIKDWATLRRSFAKGDIGFGESYILGEWESDDIEALIRVFILNEPQFEELAHGHGISQAFFRFINTIWRSNRKGRSPKNIRAHYDIGNEFYRLWLDETMTYSSALYADPAQSLAEAQRNKYGRILNHIGENAANILEIGCGWGGFAEEANKQGRHVKGLTLSNEQAEYASKRLGSATQIALQDYRDERARYDAIVSIEMFEAVGERYWPVYFQKIKECLREGGKAVVQTITIKDEFFDDYRKRSDFIRHYTFPGGMLPAMQPFTRIAADAGLSCQNVKEFGQDYAATLREWLDRFEAALPQIKLQGHDDGFIRGWRFYMEYCAAAFATERTNVMQVTLQHQP